MSDAVVARIIAAVFLVPGLIGLGFSMTHDGYGLVGLFGGIFCLASMLFNTLAWQAAREAKADR